MLYLLTCRFHAFEYLPITERGQVIVFVDHADIKRFFSKFYLTIREKDKQSIEYLKAKKLILNNYPIAVGIDEKEVVDTIFKWKVSDMLHVPELPLDLSQNYNLMLMKNGFIEKFYYLDILKDIGLEPPLKGLSISYCQNHGTIHRHNYG
jgi:hypothetical protein